MTKQLSGHAQVRIESFQMEVLKGGRTIYDHGSWYLTELYLLAEDIIRAAGQSGKKKTGTSFDSGNVLKRSSLVYAVSCERKG